MLEKILHVDDDDDIRMLTKVALETVGGFTLLQCVSGRDALEKAETFGPDLILLDVMMPGLDGEQTFLKLRENTALSSSPIVFVTAKVHDQSVNQLFALGAAGVIAKPFDPLALPNTLRSIWTRTVSDI